MVLDLGTGVVLVPRHDGIVFLSWMTFVEGCLSGGKDVVVLQDDVDKAQEATRRGLAVCKAISSSRSRFTYVL